MHLRFFYSMAMYMKLSSTNVSQIYLRTYLRLKTVSRNNPILRYLFSNKHGGCEQPIFKGEQTDIIIRHVAVLCYINKRPD